VNTENAPESGEYGEQTRSVEPLVQHRHREHGGDQRHDEADRRGIGHRHLRERRHVEQRRRAEHQPAQRLHAEARGAHPAQQAARDEPADHQSEIHRVARPDDSRHRVRLGEILAGGVEQREHADGGNHQRNAAQRGVCGKNGHSGHRERPPF